MTRARPPRVAVGEAMHAAADRGYEVIPIPADSLQFDFIISSRRYTALVRVRRLRYARYDPKEIRDSCAAEIAGLRGIAIFPEIIRELWARGPHRGWHRYRIFMASIEEIVEEEGEDPEDGNSEKSGTLDRTSPENQPVPSSPGIPPTENRPIPGDTGRIQAGGEPAVRDGVTGPVPPDAPPAPTGRPPQAPLAGG